MRPFLSRQANGTAVALAIGGCLVLILLLIAGRGVWLDEASTLWLAQHDIGFARIVQERWIHDVHPPLYSLYAWAAEPILGESIRALRLINLGGLIVAALIWRQAARRGLDRDFLAIFAILVAASPFFMLYAAELRSYFLQMLLGACLIVQLRLIHEGRGGMVWLAVVALLLTNLHYYGSLVGLILIGAEALWLARHGRGREAAGLLLLIAAVAIPLAISALAMLSVITPVPSNATPASRAFLLIAMALGGALLPNIAAWAWLIRLRPRPVDRGFLVVLAGALLAIAAVYFGLNVAKGNLVARHMIAAGPIAAALAAILLEDVVKQRRIIMVWISVNAMLLAIAAAYYGLAVNKRWESNVAPITAARTACPTTRIYALNAVSLFADDDPKRGEFAINDYFRFAYQVVAARAGWPITIVPDGRAIRPAGHCPSLLWIEHHYARRDASDEQLARIAGFAGPLAIRRLQRGDARVLLEISPK